MFFLLFDVTGIVFSLQRQRKKLAEKIEQLNTAIDDISSQMKHDDSQDEAVVNSDGVGAEVTL